jgi:hypothetical protein
MDVHSRDSARLIRQRVCIAGQPLPYRLAAAETTSRTHSPGFSDCRIGTPQPVDRRGEPVRDVRSGPERRYGESEKRRAARALEGIAGRAALTNGGLRMPRRSRSGGKGPGDRG